LRQLIISEVPVDEAEKSTTGAPACPPMEDRLTGVNKNIQTA
jgi:hypothetical protein